jgi:hypothetical protein
LLFNNDFRAGFDKFFVETIRFIEVIARLKGKFPGNAKI